LPREETSENVPVHSEPEEKSCLNPRALGLQYWKLGVECWKFQHSTSNFQNRTSALGLEEPLLVDGGEAGRQKFPKPGTKGSCPASHIQPRQDIPALGWLAVCQRIQLSLGISAAGYMEKEPQERTK